MSVYVVIPTYNEVANIELMVREIIALEPPFDVVVVDDNSPDGTADLVAKLSEECDRVHLVKRAGKLGFASAEIAGIRYALERRPTHICHMDADFSHQPKHLPEMLKLATEQDLDVVVGSRYCPGGGTQNWGLSRVILSRGANFVARTLLGLKVDDCTSGFRCYRREVLEEFDFSQITVDGYSFLVEMTYLFQRRGCRFGQVPIIFEDRTRGKSKISRRIIREAMCLVFRRFLDRVFHRGAER